MVSLRNNTQQHICRKPLTFTKRRIYLVYKNAFFFILQRSIVLHLHTKSTAVFYLATNTKQYTLMEAISLPEE